MKEKFLKLIDAYIKDDEAINGIPKSIQTNIPLIHENGRCSYKNVFEGVFIMNSKGTQKPLISYKAFHNDKWVMNDAKSTYYFEYPSFEVAEFDYYSMTFSFENQPPISILSRSEKLVVNKKGTGKKKSLFGNQEVEMTFEYTTTSKPVHYLTCGTFEFEMTDSEVEEIYNKIENRRLELSKAAELVELNKRFEKYGIQ